MSLKFLKFERKQGKQVDAFIREGGGFPKDWESTKYFLKHPGKRKVFDTRPVDGRIYFQLKKGLKKQLETRRHSYYSILR